MVLSVKNCEKQRKRTSYIPEPRLETCSLRLLRSSTYYH